MALNLGGSLASPVRRYGNTKIEPAMRPDRAVIDAVRLGVSTTFHKGDPIAQVTGTNAIETLTIGGTPTSGTFAITYAGFTTGPITWSAVNATLFANIQAALDALQSIGVGNTLVANLSCTAGIGTISITFQNDLGAKVIVLPTSDGSLLVGTAPTAVITNATPGVAGSNGLYVAYASGGGDGTQNAKAILMYDVTTDANGFITYGDGTLGNDYDLKEISTPAYFSGIFAMKDMPTTITSGVISSLGGRFIEGTITARGIFSF